MLSGSMSRDGGGVTTSMCDLGQSLVHKGIDVEVFAAWDKHSEIDLQHWADIKVSLHEVKGPSSFGWQSNLFKSLQNANLDILHQHGIWMYPSLAAIRWGKKHPARKVISPHGMLDPWALRNSGYKKAIAMKVFEKSNLQTACCIHALTSAEKLAIRACGIDAPVAVIPNGVALPDLTKTFAPPSWEELLPNDAKVLLFLGRIHPKKGLNQLIQALAELKEDRFAEWHLVVAGWDQLDTRRNLEKLSDELKLTNRIHFVGPQFGPEKENSFIRADAFVLPSLSEGLPVAVLEAFSYELPVLMTEECNLPDGFTSAAAIEISKNLPSMVTGLKIFFELQNLEQKKMGKNGRQLIVEKYSNTMVTSQMKSIYEWMAGSGDAPLELL